MQQRVGVFGIIASLSAFSLIYWGYMSGHDDPIQIKISFFVGSLAALCMATAFVISARPRLIEPAFGGLDRMYKIHKILGITSLILFLIHFATAPDGEAPKDSMPESAAEEGHLPIGPLGIFSALGFIILIILTLNRKFAYNRWFKTHQFMGLFFTLVSAHIILVLYEGRAIGLTSPPGMILTTALIIGLTAFVYKLLIYPRRERHHFELTGINRLERATELVLTPLNEMFAFKPGQFSFVTIDAPGFREAHPFTISSAPNDGELKFTMKVLGDYTRRVRDDLNVGHRVEIDGPYGRFNPLDASGSQIWIAGGVGITPFLSALRALPENSSRTIQLYYCVREIEEALFLDELRYKVSKLPNAALTVFESDKGEFITAEIVAEFTDLNPGDWQYFLCGPKPMINSVTKGLKARGVQSSNFHHEEFEMR